MLLAAAAEVVEAVEAAGAEPGIAVVATAEVAAVAGRVIGAVIEAVFI